MTIIEEIYQKYRQLSENLSNEFFETINKGTPEQERRLRLDKSPERFNQLYTELTQRHQEELAANGYIEPEPEPPRDLATEVDDLQARVKELEKRRG